MCMLIHHTPKSHLTHDMLRNFLEHNPDGFGFAFGDKRKVHVIKVPTPDFKTVASLYTDYVKGREAVVHFRWRTHGEVNHSNTHPFEVCDGIWMAHNGVLPSSRVAQRDLTMSDTWHLIEDYLRPLLSRDPALLYEQAFQKMLGEYIGSGNKLAFVGPSGKVVVINHTSGLTWKNTWFSNRYAWDPEQFGAVSPHEYATKTVASKSGDNDWWSRWDRKSGRSQFRSSVSGAYQDGAKTVVPAKPYAPDMNGRKAQRVEELPLTKKQRKHMRSIAGEVAKAGGAHKTKTPAPARTLVLPEGRPNIAIYGDMEFDRSWLRKDFEALGIPMRRTPPVEPRRPDLTAAGDARTKEIAQRLLLQNLELQREH